MLENIAHRSLRKPGNINKFVPAEKRQTVELYLLSIIHSLAWTVACAYKAFIKKELWNEHGSTRGLLASAGFYTYVLLTVKSVWTHPSLVLLSVLHLTRIASFLRSRAIGWLIIPYTALNDFPEGFLALRSLLEFVGEPQGSWLSKGAGYVLILIVFPSSL